MKKDEQQEKMNCLLLRVQPTQIKEQIDKEMADVVLSKEIKERIVKFMCLSAE